MWSAYTKTLIKECSFKNKAIVCPVYGIFSVIRNFSGESDTNRDAAICYMPSSYLAKKDGEHLVYVSKPPYNLPSVSMEHIKATKLFKPNALERIPYSHVAQLTGLSEQQVVFVLKQIIMCVEHTLETGYTVKLNLRIGHLRFSSGNFQFINDKNQDMLSDAATSCNTEYRTNKRYLTNLRERPDNALDQ